MATTISRPPITEEALKIYAGKWVALRAGEVIAAAEDYHALVADEHVEPTDAIFHVPSASSLFY
jgi:Family of unknown function (DUF5678)